MFLFLRGSFYKMNVFKGWCLVVLAVAVRGLIDMRGDYGTNWALFRVGGLDIFAKTRGETV